MDTKRALGIGSAIAHRVPQPRRRAITRLPEMVEFTTADGRKVVFTGSIGTSYAPEVGGTLPVRRWVAGGCMRALTDAPRCPVVRP
jgi:hypothetical protein